ncbi:MAG: hypothetical protein PHR92_16360 [Lachnospiraceae bacterium]|nr:hypothetical protein [Lachnospiraceae bacterium]
MTNLPKTITVCRIPYKVGIPEEGYSYEVLPDRQEINVTDQAAPARKRQYFMWEITHLLLEAAGMTEKNTERYYRCVGSVLNRFVIDNNLDWVKGDKPLPNSLWINGIPYTIEYGDFEELKKDNLGGQVIYDLARIRVKQTMERDILLYVIIHECAHAMLFEAVAGGYESKEPFVEALAWQILYFLQDNDLTKIKPDKEN